MRSNIPSSGDEAKGQFQQFVVAGLIVPLAALVIILSYLHVTGTILERKEWKQIAAILWIGGLLSLVFAAVAVYRSRPKRGEPVHRAFTTQKRSTLSTGNIFCLFFIPACAFAGIQFIERTFQFKLDQGQWQLAVGLIWLAAFAQVGWSSSRRTKMSKSSSQSFPGS